MNFSLKDYYIETFDNGVTCQICGQTLIKKSSDSSYLPSTDKRPLDIDPLFSSTSINIEEGNLVQAMKEKIKKDC